jgi:cardiolipin synthase
VSGKGKRRGTIALIVVFHVLGALSSIHAIMHTRTEQGAIAWAVSLNTLPYAAVPAYWVLGRSRFEGYVSARRENMEEVVGLTKEAVAAVAPFRVPDAEVGPAAQAAQHLAGPFLLRKCGRLLVNGTPCSSILRAYTARSTCSSVSSRRRHRPWLKAT